MSALPEIPDSVTTLDELGRWIDSACAGGLAESLADRMRLTVAVMDRAVLIGERLRAETATDTPAAPPAGASSSPSFAQPENDDAV
ncbi:hypothetical protein [Sphingomonas hengshuiensis]|uniref:Uncharacterized protein n=1 Tax=Sphingomonas hengshuiensis TaxID=1609977 RepID=A0A7U4LFW7_9SPHN|nr:hypothetical protein [Sphingomonas hengshuiensis]AJP72954.1 hypothetical protein TS85_15875 [Sphingomonas hengshuiensis]